MRKVVLSSALLLCFSLSAGEWHFRVKPLVGYKGLDAASLKDDFDQTHNIWMSQLCYPLVLEGNHPSTVDLGVEASLPLLSNLSACAKLVYLSSKSSAGSSTQNYTYPYFETLSIGSNLYTLNLMGGINLYKYLEEVPSTIFYLQLAGGLSSLHLKRKENFRLNYIPEDEFIIWNGTYTDYGYCADILIGFEIKVRNRCFVYVESGYSYISFGSVKGDEKWTAYDVATPYWDYVFAHTPPDVTYTYPYNGTLEQSDVQAELPDGKVLHVDLSGYVIRVGLGFYIF